MYRRVFLGISQPLIMILITYNQIPGMYAGAPKRNLLVALLYLTLLLFSVSTIIQVTSQIVA